MGIKSSVICDGCGDAEHTGASPTLPKDWHELKMEIGGERRAAQLCNGCKLALFNAREKHRGGWFSRIKALWAKVK